MEAYQELEQKFGAWATMPHCVACSSGTSALHLALEAFKLPPGSAVLLPEFTMVACARAVTMAGLRPVFVDCTDDLLMDVEELADLPVFDARAIMPVHIYGRRCNMPKIHNLAMQEGLAVVEDCAEIHGAPLSGKADAYCFSFYKNKIVYGEEGGIIVFAKSAFADVARELRSHGFTPEHDFLHAPRGVNARLSNAHASLILASFEQMEENLAKRREVEGWYNELVPQEWHMPAREVCWVYDIRIPKTDLYAVIKELGEKGIQARHSFKPMSAQPEYQGHFKHLNAFRLSREVIYLPVYPDMTRERVEAIVEALKNAVTQSTAKAA